MTPWAPEDSGVLTGDIVLTVEVGAVGTLL